jgi:hypothetical protein
VLVSAVTGLLPEDNTGLDSGLEECLIKWAESCANFALPGVPKRSGLSAHYQDDFDLGSTILGSIGQSSIVASVGLAEGKVLALAAALISAPGEVCTIRKSGGASFSAHSM